MSDNTQQNAPDQDTTGQTAVPTPTPGADAGEVNALTPEQVHSGSEAQAPEQTQAADQAETPEQAESPEEAAPNEVPSNEELEEPSTEKDPGDEPKAPSRQEGEPDHEAVGIGVIGQPQIDEDATAD
ncbi:MULTISPECIES: hypothetical protein [unclassified Microbacterium]|uniref:hypothetical protein n=1 Tax=unclassified Microbacterium TaxID=2609290 RepID=UPI00203663DB|nr:MULTISPECIES: hypothetical protein [unclassified Microbacterium]